MTGPHDGVIGMDRNGIIKRFLDGLPARFDVAGGDIQMNCVLIETDDAGPRNSAGRLKAKSIERLLLRADWRGRELPRVRAGIAFRNDPWLLQLGATFSRPNTI